VSVNSTGTATANGVSSSPAVSSDGRFVAFQSQGTNLVTGVTDANGIDDIFVRDRTAGSTMLVSINSFGSATGNDASSRPLISADGHLVVFESNATNLLSGVSDANGNASDIFVRDITAGTTRTVSINHFGTATGNGSSTSAAMSAAGDVIAFVSSAGDLVP